MTYNCLVTDASLSVAEYGSVTLVAGAGQTLYQDVGKKPSNAPLHYMKISNGLITEMTELEKDAMDIHLFNTAQAQSTGAAKITAVYATENDLPSPPPEDGLVAIIVTPERLALSIGGQWLLSATYTSAN